MKGWTKVPPTPGHHTDTEQCDAENCGAYVRAKEKGRRADHDREFHLLRIESGGPNDGYLLHLDGKEVGYIYDKVVHYNLRRTFVSHTWTALFHGGGSVVGDDRFTPTMAEVVTALGAKAWGRGQHPRVWHYPDEVSR